MELRSYSRQLVLTLPEAAAFVSMPSSSRYFIPLLGCECTAAELADRVGVSIGAATYRLRQMVDLRLIERTRLQRRKGRSIAHYRAVADRVFAPLELTPIDSLRELFRQGLSDIADNLEASVEAGWLRVGRSRQWGTLLYRSDPAGSVNRDFVPQSLTEEATFWDAALTDEAPAIWSQHATLDLPHDVAKRLQRELADIVARYAELAKEQANTQAHHVQLVLAPAIGSGGT